MRHLTLDGVGDAGIDLSASVGVAFFPEDGDSPKSLMKAADDALYAAKRAGRDRVVLAESIKSEVTEDS